MNLKDALENIISKTTASDSIIMVDELVDKIKNKYSEEHGFERGNIVNFISKTYGRKVEYNGKKKRKRLLLMSQVIHITYLMYEFDYGAMLLRV